MSNSKLVKFGLLHSTLALAYIFLIALFFNNAQKMFGDGKNFFIPIFMLLLLVLSVAVMGVLIFGKPLMLYLDGAKKEGVKLLLYTIGFLFIMTLVSSIILMIIK
ncbi:MAG: hypothetical protein PHT51_03505 [Patescibacteria group bacterium]|nr:hypothetical protein [Patescibacteria group bacterium]MDD4610433.1 hypothetical protein [Patescibacteria group bacterium]